ncbi:MAG: hypothetical protein WBG46_13245 [Nonlabens sp.]
MATLISQISSIRLKINGLIDKNRMLEDKIRDYENQLAGAKEENASLVDRLKENEDRIIALKTANAMLGSDDYKTKTKLKINALVKEIDQCIAQLT